MLFTDTINQTNDALKPAFDSLFEDMLANQSHSGDALLIHVNGFHNPDVHNWKLEKKMSPYMIGPNMDGWSEQLHYSFIHNYRTTAIFDKTYSEYIELHKYSPERKEEIDSLVEYEGASIQLEMLVYLKVWEMDAFIKKFYQTAKLVNGEAYDWHFKIEESNRDNNTTGKRHEIIRTLVRDRLKQYEPIFNSFKKAYLTQIRNSIAHSKYGFMGRTIHPNNFVSADKAAQIENFPFDEWITMFHETMAIYNQSLRLSNKINEHYGTLALENNNQVEVRIERKDPKVTTEICNLIYREEFKDWRWERQ